MDKLILPFEKKSAPDEKGVFSGYGSAFGNVDYGRDIAVRGCFAKSLNDWEKKGKLPALRFNHDSGEACGDWLTMKEVPAGLDCDGKLWIEPLGALPPTDAANKSYRMMKGTGPVGLSIGYITEKSDYDKEGNRLLLVVELLEVSVVSFGMNPGAVITDVKSRLLDASGKLVDVRTAEKIIRETLDLSASQAKAFLADGWKALTTAARDVSDVEGISEATKSLQATLKLLKESNQ